MKWFKWLLFPLSVFFWSITGLRNLFYNLNWLRSVSFDLPIINVGNITVGGTGKTPHIMYIGHVLNKSLNPAFLSKGYKRDTNLFTIVESSSKSRFVGDESLMIKKNFPKNIVAVDHSRLNGVLKLIDQFEDIDCILLDDAYQHRSIKPGLNILLIDFNRPIFSDTLLPVGELRESRKNKDRADLVIVTKCPEVLTQSEGKSFSSKLNMKCDIYFTFLKYDGIRSIFNKEEKDISHLRNKKIILVTGIANQSQVIIVLENLNCTIINHKYPDHYKYKDEDVNLILSSYKENQDAIILTTEKDAQKLEEFNELKSAPLFFLKLSIDFHWNKDKFDKKIIEYAKGHSTNS